MDNHTAPELLEAVGIDWRADASLHTWDNGLTSTCSYTGPALGTPELDAILLGAGFKWMLDHGQHEARFIVQENPGHALARAIAEVCHA